MRVLRRRSRTVSSKGGREPVDARSVLCHHAVCATLREKLFTVAVTLLFVASIFAAPSATASAQRPVKVLSVLHLNYGFPAESLDPQADIIQQVVYLVHAGLVRRLPSGRATPDLATWTVSKNGLVYTFTIRKNARFSNGHHVRAQDVLFSFKRSLSPVPRPYSPIYLGLIEGAGAYQAGKTKVLSGVKVLDSHRLQITLTKPAGNFLNELTYSPDFVLDPTVVRNQPVERERRFRPPHTLRSDTCVSNQGAGPFMFVCHDHRSTLHSFYAGGLPMYTLVPNPYYWGHKPHIKIEIPQLLNGNDYKSYLEGKVDVSGVPPPFLSRWRGKSKQYHPFPSSLVDYLIPNVHMPPFSNLHCRLALAYAIDRQTLADKIASGQTHATYAMVPKGMLGYYDGKNNPHYSPSRARAELARCPYRTAPIDLVYSGQSGADPTAPVKYLAVVNMVRAIGMNVRPKQLSGPDYVRIAFQSLDQTKTQIVSGTWFPDYADPQDYCSLMLHSGQQYNTGGWHDATYDRLVDRADALLSAKTRAQLYIRAQHIGLSKGAIIPLDFQTRPTLIRPYVHGLTGSSAWDPADWVPKADEWSNVSVVKH